jgi:small subunit ribosomal protein S17e
MVMGRVRTKDIKTVAFNLIQQHQFTTDFEKNKKIISEINLGVTKKMRNKIAGYITRVMKRNKRIEKP